MIHLIWNGKGFLVAVFVFGSSLIANLLTNAATGSGAYWDGHKWPFALSLLVSAIPCWFVGGVLARAKSRVLVDPNTHEEVVLRPSHTLFFVPMLWWAPILAACGVIVLAVELSR